MIKTKKRKMLTKRSISLWISFILLILFAVILSVFTMGWIKNRAKGSSSDMKKVLYHDEICNMISILVNVTTTATNVNINIENFGTWRIDRVMIEFFNGSIPISDNEYDSKIRPGYNTSINVTREGNIIYITPIIRKDNIKIICEDKKNKIELE